MQEVVFSALGSAGGGVAFFWGFSIWRKLRLIEDTPTAKVRSMPMGRVEVTGRAEEKAELVAPISQRPCVYYRYKVEEERHNGKRTSWHTIESGDSSAWGFYLCDETGQVLVLPKGAQIELERDLFAREGGLAALFSESPTTLNTERWRNRGFLSSLLGGRNLRFSEWRIEAGDPVYVLGIAQERPGIAAEKRQQIIQKLKALKEDPEAMAHFDHDGDGNISADEWEVARQLVQGDVSHDIPDDRVVIASEPVSKLPFLISDRDESALCWRLRWRSWLGVFGGASLSVASLWFLLRFLGVLRSI